MPLNTNAPYVGRTQALNDATAAAIGLGIVMPGGRWSVASNNVIENGLGGYGHAEGGLAEARVTAILEEPLKTLISGNVRATAAAAITARSLQVADEDTECLMAGCLPDVMTLVQGVGRPYRCTCTWLGLADADTIQTVVGSVTQVKVTSGIADEWSASDVLIATADYGCQEIEVNVRHNARTLSSLDLRTATERRKGEAIRLGGQLVTCRVRCQYKIPEAVWAAATDSITKNNVIVWAVGATPSITHTLNDLVPMGEYGSAFESDDGNVLYEYNLQALHRYTSGTAAAIAIT